LSDVAFKTPLAILLTVGGRVKAYSAFVEALMCMEAQ
jgi:hypothetical protein